MLAWMQWTAPTAAFLILLALGITGMTIWDMKSPSFKRKGFLPVAFTRGERFFLSIITFFAVMLLWLAFLPDISLWYAVPVAVVLIILLVRYG
jgi:predicted small integral membrane protein